VNSIDIFPNANVEGITQTVDQQNPATVPLVLTIEQAAERLGIGRSLMYALVMSGEVESVTIGRLRRIPTDALTAYVAKLRQASRPEEVA
jgi:excisionase family DNA binding protein